MPALTEMVIPQRLKSWVVDEKSKGDPALMRSAPLELRQGLRYALLLSLPVVAWNGQCLDYLGCFSYGNIRQ
jgi:hypothetical protein